jgi:cation transport ATPase
MSQIWLWVRGMDCADEAALIRRALAGNPGVVGLEFDLVNGRVEVGFDPNLTTADAVLAAVRRTGLGAELRDPGKPGAPGTDPLHARAHDHAVRDRSTAWTVASGILLTAGWLVEGFNATHWLEGLAGHSHDPRASVLYGLSALAGLWPMWPRAVAALRHRRLDMHVLVCVSVAGAAAIGEWAEGAAVAFLFAVAHRMEAWSLERARSALAELTGRGTADMWAGWHRRAPTERWIERFAGVYTPIVTGAALAVALGPPLVSGHWSLWFYRALVFLVLACPCALVISTPVTVVAAVTSAARRGVLIKGGAPLEQAAGAEGSSASALEAAGVVVATIADPAPRIASASVVVQAGASAQSRTFLVAHARRTMAVIRQNVAVALATKLAFLIVASVGAAPLWAAVLADTGATVVVTLNGLRLLHAHDAPSTAAPVPQRS